MEDGLAMRCKFYSRKMYAILLIGLLLIPIAGRSQANIELMYLPEEGTGAKTMNVPLTDGSYFLGRRLRVTPDSRGLVSLRLDITKPGFLYVGTKNGLLEIYIEPQKTVRVEIGTTVVFSGDLKNENNLLLKFSRSYRSGHSEFEIKFIKTTSAGAFVDSLDRAINRDLSKLEEEYHLQPHPLVSLKDIISTNIRLFFYSQAESAIAYRIAQRGRTEGSNTANWDWSQIRETVFKKELIECGLSGSVWYAEYLNNYMNYLWSLSGEKFTNENEAILRMKSISDSHLQGKAKEVFLAHYISVCSTMGTYFFTQSLVDLFNQLKTEFPNSQTILALLSKITEVRSYLNPDDKAASAGVVIIDHFRQISSFDSLIQRFKGKVVLIDIWATWCNPCLEEFKYYAPIVELTQKRKDFVVLFISRDKIGNENRWRKFVTSNKLIGFHLIPNAKLAKDLRSQINWDAIPRYAIVDKEGRIVNKNASTPSSGRLLEEIKTNF